MTRNQKIAVGCGGAGCLGLIVVAIAAGLIYYFARSATNRNYNYNVTTNRNSNSNDDTTNSNSSSSSVSSAAASMSDDDKHKLYHAALMTADQELIRRVAVRMGLMNEDFTPGDEYEQFVTNHVGWVLRNTSFIRSISTAEKAREYVNNNLPD
jgi:hypothetical protein